MEAWKWVVEELDGGIDEYLYRCAWIKNIYKTRENACSSRCFSDRSIAIL